MIVALLLTHSLIALQTDRAARSNPGFCLPDLSSRYDLRLRRVETYITHVIEAQTLITGTDVESALGSQAVRM